MENEVILNDGTGLPKEVVETPIEETHVAPVIVPDPRIAELELENEQLREQLGKIPTAEVDLMEENDLLKKKLEFARGHIHGDLLQYIQ